MGYRTRDRVRDAKFWRELGQEFSDRVEIGNHLRTSRDESGLTVLDHKRAKGLATGVHSCVVGAALRQGKGLNSVHDFIPLPRFCLGPYDTHKLRHL